MSDSPVSESKGLADDPFGVYAPDAHAFDEARQATGQPREHWRLFAESMRRLGTPELASRWESGRRILGEHGVTYNVYGDPQGTDRPWSLDLVPLLISAKDFEVVEAAMAQRSRLFNLILADLYGGGQRLLRDGFLPPDVIYTNPGFARPCRGITPARNVYLHLHACDLARSPDGAWWVLADRTQAPSGAGYALENRTVLSRILPDEIRESNVSRLGGFFRAQRDMLRRLAPAGSDSPSVALLTPGPHNETYFEHAYLARHLGFPLVEGADLTVRDQRVFLKTLEGLQPVDVLLRRVDDAFCDPLELRGQSILGVPGLVEATRAGRVTVANALGSGLVESPVFLAFLPGLCRHVLGEDLIMPSVATWWCGQGQELRYVLEHLDQLVIKPAFGPPTRQPWFGGRLSRAERGRLADLIRACPQDFVGQERVVLSRAPVWAENRFQARSIVLRAYVASDGESFAVLPGGLTRVSRTAEDPVVSMQSGGGSKDTWVLAGGVTERLESAAVLGDARVPERAQFGVPSRAADHLYWLGRYTERLEQTLRALRCVLGRLSDQTASESLEDVSVLAALASHIGLRPMDFGPAPGARDLEQQLLRLLYEPGLIGGARELLSRIRLAASAVRDRFSGDTWRILGRLEGDGNAQPGGLPLAGALALIHNLVLDLAAFNGMEMENMTRGHGWRLLDLGRRVERGLSLVRLLRAALAVPARPDLVLEPVLEIADCVMTYRRRYFAGTRLDETLELLLLDESNPRSVAFQTRMLADHTAELPRPSGASPPAVGAQRIQALKTALAAPDGNGNPNERSRRLSSLAAELEAFSNEVTSRYFSHTNAPRLS